MELTGGCGCRSLRTGGAGAGAGAGDGEDAVAGVSLKERDRDGAESPMTGFRGVTVGRALAAPLRRDLDFGDDRI